MNPVRAIIFDVYKTILDVDEAPLDAEKRWQNLLVQTFGNTPGPNLEEVADRCTSIIREDHSEARGRGIDHPEVNWPTVMKRALPALDSLSAAKLANFIFHHAQLSRTLKLAPSCSSLLHQCVQGGILLGIASNAQAYTLRELQVALKRVRLDSAIFQEDLTFWSFQHGFSKPNPYVFQILRARLLNRRIESVETLMVGDREDNDLSPAATIGWRTWQFSKSSEGAHRGNWESLARFLFGPNASARSQHSRSRVAGQEF
jgi:FMN phosphatase YigB (HAD superfamily)